MTGTGSQGCPVKSITRGLAVAGATASVTTVNIKGGSTTAPLVYSAMTTGEISPLSPPKALSIVGEDQATVTVSGQGDCATGSRFNLNRGLGVVLNNGARWTSSGDSVTDNRESGVQIG